MTATVAASVGRVNTTITILANNLGMSQITHIIDGEVGCVAGMDHPNIANTANPSNDAIH